MGILSNLSFIRQRIAILRQVIAADNFKQHFENIFLFQGGRKTPLEIQLDLESISCIKVCMYGINNINESSITLYADNSEIPLHTHAKVELFTDSALTEDSDEPSAMPAYIENGCVVPYALFTFPTPMNVSHIRIFNVYFDYEKPQTLYVSTKKNDSGVYDEVFNLPNRIEALFATVPPASVDEGRQNQVRLLDTVIIYFLLQKTYLVTTSIKYIEEYMPPEALFSILSEEILYPLGKEYSIHGIKRTFRFWPVRKKQQYLYDSLKIITILKEITHDVCFGYGTVLGFVREMDSFIPHDNDIDVVIALPEYIYSDISSVAAFLAQYLNFKFSLYNIDKIYSIKNIFGSFIQIIANNNTLDLFPAIYDYNGNILASPLERGRYINYDVMFPTVDISIQSFNCPVPHNVVRYLDITYGKNWRVPINRQCHKSFSKRVRFEDRIRELNHPLRGVLYPEVLLERAKKIEETDLYQSSESGLDNGN